MLTKPRNINKCNTCKKDLPECGLPGVEFGNGFGQDNIVKCDGYEERKADDGRAIKKKKFYG